MRDAQADALGRYGDTRQPSEAERVALAHERALFRTWQRAVQLRDATPHDHPDYIARRDRAERLGRKWSQAWDTTTREQNARRNDRGGR